MGSHDVSKCKWGVPIIGNLSLFKLARYLLGKTKPQLIDKLEL